MTVETASTVVALLEEEPLLRVYQYVHARTGRTLYACFPRGQYDDMHEAPEVTQVQLLYDAGVPTRAGQQWRRHHTQ